METIVIMSVVYVITLILFGYLVRYYRNEIQDRVRIHKELFLDYCEVVSYNEILETQNLKYSKISRNLYNNNQDLRLELEKVAKTKKKTKAVK
jgi:hypothetical protein